MGAMNHSLFLVRRVIIFSFRIHLSPGHCCGNNCDSRCFLKCFPVCPTVETLLRKQNLLPEKQKCFLANSETFDVYLYSGKHGETLAGNNVSATMFPSLPQGFSHSGNSLSLTLSNYLSFTTQSGKFFFPICDYWESQYLWRCAIWARTCASTLVGSCTASLPRTLMRFEIFTKWKIVGFEQKIWHNYST
jgi:hypothetical protein